MSLAKNQIKAGIKNFLKSHGIMTLATVSGRQPWTATVYYGVDDNLNFYIVTDPASRHGQEFSKNPSVAFNIFDSHQKNSDPVKIGLQGTGTISQVKGLLATTQALALWHRANPGMEARISIKDLIKRITDSRIYKIIPLSLKHFNKQLYGQEKYGLLKL